ncbi:O-antigen ligase family protein [Tsukamurella paurometabola]|uniref:Lipid A core - O-antigen ligase and related enzymes n=1 Tax=Tsukamurella paurometabola TaxID=2061 RepID=A0A3P8LDR9_TSUPA|nr:O-antigen ligase family protein [Tsukamurella paurometabola]UEA81359.1 O-antigen ligase family protein [Tsukamurella paurometabola]VDR38342.1 Lipid A core - O-antigen ligase and related enzymes [Tsukamurella paurometabola]
MSTVIGRGAPSTTPARPVPWFPSASHERPPDLSFALFVGTAGFFLLGMQQTYTVPGTFGLSVGQTLFALAGITWVCLNITGFSGPIRSKATLIAVLAYVTTSFLSFGASQLRGVPYVAQVALDRYILGDLYLLGTVLFLLTVLRSVGGLRIVLGAFVIGATVSAWFGLVMVGTGIDLAKYFTFPGLNFRDYQIVTNLMREGVARPQGSAGHPLELSAILTVMTPMAISLALDARGRRAGTYWLWLGCTTILIGGALVTLSRSAVVGTIAAVVVMCWRWPITRVASVIVGGGIAIGLGLLFQLKFISAMFAVFAGAFGDDSLHSRGRGLTYASEHFWEHPWLGQGVGAYPALKQPVLDNQYVSRLMEAGVIGFVTFVAALAVALFLALRASAAADRSVADLGGGIAGSLAAMIVISFILDTAGFIQIWYLTWILVALAGVTHRLRKDTDPAARRS